MQRLVFPSTSNRGSLGAEATTQTRGLALQKFCLTQQRQQRQKVLIEYTGVISSAAWDDTNVELSLNSLLDAVGQKSLPSFEQSTCRQHSDQCESPGVVSSSASRTALVAVMATQSTALP